MDKSLKWPVESSHGNALNGFRWQQPGSNICLDLHGNPLTAKLIVFSDGNHHMALEACCQAFRENNPEVEDIFYATTPPNVILQSTLQGGLVLGNLHLNIQPQVFISPENILNKLVDAGLMKSHQAFAKSRGNVLLIKKGNPKNIHNIADLLRDDVRLAMSNPITEAASYSVYKETLLTIAAEQGLDVAAFTQLIDNDSTRVVFGKSIHHREIPQIIFSDHADAAIIYSHLALRYTRIFPDDFAIIELNSSANVCTDYYIGLINDGGKWGQSFHQFMFSAQAATLYQEHGLSHYKKTPPEGG